MGWLDTLARPRTAKQIAGDAGEQQALNYLQRQGLSLVERNFRCKGGEVDLIMRERDMLVFVEVRQRADGRYGGAVASITARKQARLVIAAQLFLQRFSFPPACRFDVVAIEAGEIQWLKNVIDT
jgi:putative endonuclease